MIELQFEYWNKLASQIIFISALLGGFSLTVLVLLLENEKSSRLMTSIFKVSTIATGAFLVTIFSMTKILMMTTEGYPLEVTNRDLNLPRLIGILTFFTGIISVITIVSLAGWTKSSALGKFTTLVGLLCLVLILLMIS